MSTCLRSLVEHDELYHYFLRAMEVVEVVTTGAIRRAKLQLNHHQQ